MRLKANDLRPLAPVTVDQVRGARERSISDDALKHKPG